MGSAGAGGRFRGAGWKELRACASVYAMRDYAPVFRVDGGHVDVTVYALALDRLNDSLRRAEVGVFELGLCARAAGHA